MASLVARYEPGGLELEWKPPLPVPSGGEVPICAVARRKQIPARRRTSLAALLYAESSRGEQPRRPHPNESAVLSRFAASNGCDEYIEPLTGLARHPFALGIGCPGRSGGASSPTAPDKYNIDHLILANGCADANDRCNRRRFEGRSLYYDLGCSVWGRSRDENSWNSTRWRQGSGLGTSLQLFMGLYARQCVTFDRIWAWEARPFDPGAWWRHVPASVRAKLHFYNVPVDEASPFGRSSMLSVLRETARPEDFVVVKVDIDTPSVEKTIVEAMTTPPLSSLVDELFFEYHFHFGTSRGPWGKTQRRNASAPGYVEDSVDDALRLMRRLRDAGIRSHFWV